MRLFSILTVMVLAFTVFPTVAEEKKEAKKATVPEGVWTKKTGDFTLKLSFKKGDIFVFEMFNDSNDGIVMESKATVKEKGKIECEVTKFEKKGNFPVEKEKGYKFSFKYEGKEKTAFFTDFTGEGIDTEAKNLIEGEYEKAK